VSFIPQFEQTGKYELQCPQIINGIPIIAPTKVKQSSKPIKDTKHPLPAVSPFFSIVAQRTCSCTIGRAIGAGSSNPLLQFGQSQILPESFKGYSTLVPQ